MRRWRKDSEFGDGPRVPLDREQRAVFRARLKMRAYRQVGRLTVTASDIGRILVDMLGDGGRLDPSIATLATLAGVDPTTVVRALARLRECGLVTWVRRLVRDGNRVEQTSNAYVLTVPGTPDLHFAQGVRLRFKSTTCRAVERMRGARLDDQEAQENAVRQLEPVARIRERRNAALNAAWWARRARPA